MASFITIYYETIIINITNHLNGKWIFIANYYLEQPVSAKGNW